MPFSSYTPEWFLLLSIFLIPAFGCEDGRPADEDSVLSDSGWDGESKDGFVADVTPRAEPSFERIAPESGRPSIRLRNSAPNPVSVRNSYDPSLSAEANVMPDSALHIEAGLPQDTGLSFDAEDEHRPDFASVYDVIGSDDNPRECPFDDTSCTAQFEPDSVGEVTLTCSNVEIACNPYLPDCTLWGNECAGVVSGAVDFDYYISFGAERLTIVAAGHTCRYDLRATALPSK